MPDRIWNAAEYTRLSRDDGDKAESNSITSQKEIIRDYVRRHPEFVIVKEYADDGYSGVNFERPGFKQMMEDIKAKKIDCVICKDLSRFARNYIDAGRYLEKIFPFMGVRFIAIKGIPAAMFMMSAKTLLKDLAESGRNVDEVFTRANAKPYDPTAAAAPDITLPAEERPIGGLGLHMVRKMSTSMQYRYSEGENRLSVGFELEKQP